jgi:hypothetical protein
MGFANSPRIVTNDLIYCLDPGNKRSYSGSGTVAFDLSKSNNTSTALEPGFEEPYPEISHSFDGGGYFSGSVLGGNIAVNATSSAPRLLEFTIDFWVYPIPGEEENLFFPFLIIPPAENGVFNLVYDNSTKDQKFIIALFDVDASDPFNPIIYSLEKDIVAGNFNGWNNFIVSFKNSGSNLTYDVCLNGVFYYASPQVESPFVSLGILLDGVGIIDAFPGRCGPTKIYNRALSREEMLQNFNAHRGRYGV